MENEAYFYGTFTARSRSISSTVVMDGYGGMGDLVLNSLRLLGAAQVTEITVNGVAHTDFEILSSGEVLVRNLGLSANSEFTITY